MKQFPDGSWHAFGIASILLGSCGGVGDHSLITGAIPWIEMTSGIDVTPCFDADGTWNPGPSCTGFSTVGPNGVGTWNNECSGQPSSGPSSSCGPSYGSTPETDPPTVDITAPQDQAMFASGELIDFAIDANDGTGWGVQRVTLEIDGQVQGDLDPKAWDGLAPWGFDGTFFNDGTFEIRALAEDGWGNTAFSDPITIYVGDAGTSGGTTSGTTSTSTSDGGASDTTGGGGTTSGESDTGCTSCTTGMDDADTADDGASLGGGDEGCACNTSGGSAPMRWFALLFTIPALGISRRRRRSSR